MVYKWIHGVDPLGEVDHIDRNPANNSPFNLRLTTRRGNGMNSSIHLLAKGVYQCANGTWRACHVLNGRQLSVSGFVTEAEALAARRALVSACAHFERYYTGLVAGTTTQKESTDDA